MLARRPRPRHSRILAATAATAIIATIGFVNMQAAQAAPPTLAAPGRIYPEVNELMAFSGTDAVSGDSRVLSVGGMVEGVGGCHTDAPAYSITSCPRIQMDLSSGEAGLLHLDNTSLVDGPDVDPNLDLLVHSSGAVITEHTETDGSDGLVFNFNGTEAMLNSVLGDMSFQTATDYEEKDTDDGSLPSLHIDAIQGDNIAEITTRDVYIKVEGVNDGPTLDAPATPVAVASGSTTDVETAVDPLDVPGVIDPEMCNFTKCGAPFTDPGLAEGDDEMLLVAWIPESSCGTFNFIVSSVFSTKGSATLNTVHKVLTDPTGLNLENDQALAIETSIDPAALLLDFTSQPASVDGNTTVFAGVGEIDEVAYALGHIDYNAPADDATCHLNYTVSDLGNNGAPTSYEGSALGATSSGEAPQPGYEVPDAKGATTNIAFQVSDAHPDVAVEQAPQGAPGDPAGPNKPATFTITFSEAIETSSFSAADLDTSAGTATGVSGVLSPVSPGLVYTFTATATGDGTIIVSVPAGGVYAAGHDGDSAFDNDASTSSDNTITWDSAGPTVTINQKAGQADPTSTSPILFTVVFSDSISSAPAQFDASDIDLSTSTAGGTLVANVTQPDALDPSTYEVAVSGMTTSGSVVATVEANAIVDQALNGNDASTSTDNTVTWQAVVDNTPPDVTVNQAGGQGDPTSTSPIVFTATFSEPVTGFVDADVSFTGSTAGGTLAAAVTGGPAVYSISVSGMTTSGTVVASIAAAKATDAANNPNNASTSTDNTVQWNQVVDNTPPTVTVEQGAQADPTSTSPIVFTATFSEPVTGFVDADVSFTGSTAGGTLAAAVTGGPAVYSISVSGMTTGGTVVASIAAAKATDAANNPNDASTSTDNTVTWVQPVDNTPPTVTVEQAAGQTDPTSTSPIVFTATFSEPVSGFVGADVTIGGTAGGTLVANVTGGPAAYSISVSGMTTSGTVTASIAAAKATDAANNPNDASTSTDNTVQWNQVVDNTAPTVTIEQAAGQTDPTATTSVDFTVTFSEPVAGFLGTDVDLSSSTAPGTLTAALSGGPSVYTVTVTGMTGNGTVVATVPAGVASDAATNANTVSTSTDNTVTFNGAITVSSGGGDVTVVASGGVLTTFTSTSPSVPPPAGFTFPYDELSFSATTTPGSLVTFTLTLPVPADEYFKLVSGAWQTFPFDSETGAQISVTTITVTVRDDGRGDSDAADGVVTDPAAPAQAVGGGTTTTTTTTPGGGSTTSTTTGTGGSTSTTARAGGASIVRTGSDTTPTTLVGFGLIAVGVGILVARGGRRPLVR